MGLLPPRHHNSKGAEAAGPCILLVSAEIPSSIKSSTVGSLCGPNSKALPAAARWSSGKRYTNTFHGSLKDARKQLRALLKSGDDGDHIAPARITVAQWVAQWIAIGAPGRKMKHVGRRTLERYDELLRCHVVPTLGGRLLQQLQATEIDRLYQQLDGQVSPRTAHHVHVVLGACLATAVRKGLIATSPLARAEKVPSPGESDHGMALEEDELRTLIEGFKGSPLYPIVCVAAFTGARRNEILALRWTDLNVTEKTLRIERAVEQVKKQPLACKGPKTERGKRTITIDDGLIAVLVAERERHLRIVAGVPDAVAVDLSLVNQSLPVDALVFPSPEGGFSFTKLRDPRAVSRVFKQRARKLGFAKLRFHDLRGTHETLLLDAGVPLKTVAERCGHDPSVLLKNYAKRSRKGDAMAAQAIAALTKGVLGNAS
jgi:integrase